MKNQFIGTTNRNNKIAYFINYVICLNFINFATKNILLF